MKKIFAILLLLCAATLQAQPKKIRVLIVDGQNNHKWQETTPLLKAILLDAGIFAVDVSTTPPAADAKSGMGRSPAWSQWHPRFSDYDVVVSNYNGEDWPAEVRAAFVAFVRDGGGFVSYHAADNSFPDWPEYNEMIGLGGWKGRTAAAGPYLVFDNGRWKSAQLPGPTGNHGARSEFVVDTQAPENPIMKGLPAHWMHPQDELYNRLRGPARNLTVLASAVSDVTHEPQPMLMTITYGKGRVFHTTLGHYVEALSGVGFQCTFTRGVEWAATGKVTLPAPAPGVLTDTSPAATHAITPVP